MIKRIRTMTIRNERPPKMILVRKIAVYAVREMQVPSSNKGNSSGSMKIEISFANTMCSYSCKQYVV